MRGPAAPRPVAGPLEQASNSAAHRGHRRRAVGCGGPELPQLAQAALWGLGRVIALEHPDLSCVRIDLDPRGGLDQATDLCGELVCDDRSEEEIAFRDGERLVLRLSRCETRHKSGSLDVARGEGSYLITGGLTGLGLATARWLVSQRARYLVLAGRSAPSEEARLAIGEMERAGARVLVVQADVSRREDVDRLLGQIDGTGVPLRGVIHAAGTFDDGVLLEQRWERFEKVMAAKVAGAWNLHQATRGIPLDFFVAYSSGASLLGSTGQGNYAAANSFLDGLAGYRQSLGLPGLAINWGPWAEVGRSAWNEWPPRGAADSALAGLDRAGSWIRRPPASSLTRQTAGRGSAHRLEQVGHSNARPRATAVPAPQDG